MSHQQPMRRLNDDTKRYDTENIFKRGQKSYTH